MTNEKNAQNTQLYKDNKEVSINYIMTEKDGIKLM